MPVSVRALGHRFGDAWLFRDVTFSVPQQGSVAVVGPSGSGKSTLLRILAGTLAPTEGSVEIPPSTRISLVHQTPHGVGPRTVIDHIALPWWARGADLTTGWHEAERIAATLGLDGALHRPFSEMSGGEAQRIRLAVAMAEQPDLILADEPTASLDAGNAMSVVASLRRVTDLGATLVVATHDPRVADACGQAVRLSGPSGDG
mgnify:CR=1 FL=1